MARSIRAATTPKSAAAADGRSVNESTCARLASQTVPGRLPPTGGWRVHRSSDQTGGVDSPAQIPQGSPPASPRRGGSGIDARRPASGASGVPRRAAPCQAPSSKAGSAVGTRPANRIAPSPGSTSMSTNPAAQSRDPNVSGSMGTQTSPVWNARKPGLSIESTPNSHAPGRRTRRVSASKRVLGRDRWDVVEHRHRHTGGEPAGTERHGHRVRVDDGDVGAGHPAPAGTAAAVASASTAVSRRVRDRSDVGREARPGTDLEDAATERPVTHDPRHEVVADVASPSGAGAQLTMTAVHAISSPSDGIGIVTLLPPTRPVRRRAADVQ